MLALSITKATGSGSYAQILLLLEMERIHPSELCINYCFCVLLTQFYLVLIVYIYTELIVGWRGGLRGGEEAVVAF